MGKGWGLYVWGQSGASLGWGATLGRGQSLLLLARSVQARPFLLAAPLVVRRRGVGQAAPKLVKGERLYPKSGARRPLQLKHKGCTGFTHCLCRSILSSELSCEGPRLGPPAGAWGRNRWLTVMQRRPFNSVCMNSIHAQPQAF